MKLRDAEPPDAAAVAGLHADSWRRHYRGAYADSYLDSAEVDEDRLAVWTERLARPRSAATVVAEDGDGLAGFVHVVFDVDAVWGSLLDNLHVRHDRQRAGIGRTLMAVAVRAVTDAADRPAMFLWVLQQNTRAQEFYRAMGGECVERDVVPPPGGVPGRLNGEPQCYRFAWRQLSLAGSV